MFRFIFLLIVFFLPILLTAQASEKLGELILIPQSGHTGGISHLSVTNDNKYFLTRGRDETVILWTIDGKQIRSLTGLDSGIRDAAISPNGKFTVIANSSEIVLADIFGNLIKKIKSYSGSSTAIAFSKDSTFFIKVKANSSGKDFWLELYDTKGNLISKIAGDEDLTKVTKIDSTKDGKRFITIGYDGKLKFWDTTGGLVKTVTANSAWKSYSSGNNFARFTPDGKNIISGGLDNTIKLWDLNGNLVKEIYKGGVFASYSSFEDLDCSPDGKYFVATDGTTVFLMDFDGKEIKKFDQFNPAGVKSLTFANDGKTILVGYGDGNISIFDGKGNLTGKALKGSSSGIYGMAYNGSTILVNGQAESYWDLESDSIEKIEGAYSVTQISYTKDNKYIVMASHHYPTVYVFDAVTKKEIRKFSTKGKVKNFSISNDNSILTTEEGSDYDNSELNLWDMEGNLIKSVAKDSGSGNFARAELSAISPDGKYVASKHYMSIKNRDISGKEIFRTSDVWQIFSIQFSAAGNYILLGQSGKAYIYDTAGKLLFNLAHEGAIDYIKSSPDEKFFLTGSRNKTVKLWDTNGKNLKTFSGHLNAVKGVDFSKDGKYVITASEEGMIRFFNIQQGLLAVTVLFTEYGIVTLSPDGRFDYADNRSIKFIAYRKGGTNEIVSLDQVFQSYYTPGLFKKILNGTQSKPVIDITTALKKNLPELKLELGAQNGGKIEINLEACDMGGGLQNIGIYQNGNLIHPDIYLSKLIQNGNCKRGVVELDLANGQNTFMSTANNSANIKAESPSKVFTYISSENQKPQMHIFVVGVDEYLDEESRLNFAVKDSKTLKEKFSAYGKAIYEKIIFYELYNSQVTRTGVLNELKKVINNAKIDDTVILVFSGHGISISGKYYYLPHDSPNIKEEATPQEYLAWEKATEKRAISSDEITDSMTKIKTANKMLIVDSCQSGGYWMSKMSESKRLQDLDEQNSDISKKSNMMGIAMISAAQEKDPAFESKKLGNGFLTSGLLEAMKEEKDRDSKTPLTAFSTIVSASKKVLKIAKRFKVNQVTFISVFGVDFDLSD